MRSMIASMRDSMLTRSCAGGEIPPSRRMRLLAVQAHASANRRHYLKRQGTPSDGGPGPTGGPLRPPRPTDCTLRWLLQVVEAGGESNRPGGDGEGEEGSRVDTLGDVEATGLSRGFPLSRPRGIREGRLSQTVLPGLDPDGACSTAATAPGA